MLICKHSNYSTTLYQCICKSHWTYPLFESWFAYIQKWKLWSLFPCRHDQCITFCWIGCIICHQFRHTCQSCSVYNESHMDTYGHQCNNQESIVIYKSELPTNNRTNGPTDQCQNTCTSDSLLDMTWLFLKTVWKLLDDSSNPITHCWQLNVTIQCVMYTLDTISLSVTIWCLFMHDYLDYYLQSMQSLVSMTDNNKTKRLTTSDYTGSFWNATLHRYRKYQPESEPNESSECRKLAFIWKYSISG